MRELGMLFRSDQRLKIRRYSRHSGVAIGSAGSATALGPVAKWGPSSSSSKKWDNLIGQTICFNIEELTGPAAPLMTTINVHMIQSHQFANISQLWCQLFIILTYHMPNKHFNNSQS